MAAHAGLHQQAAALVAFTESQLRSYRIENPLQVWIQMQLDRALDDPSAVTPASPLHRRDLLDIVTQIESALTHDASAAVSAPR